MPEGSSTAHGERRTPPGTFPRERVRDGPGASADERRSRGNVSTRPGADEVLGGDVADHEAAVLTGLLVTVARNEDSTG